MMKLCLPLAVFMFYFLHRSDSFTNYTVVTSAICCLPLAVTASAPANSLWLSSRKTSAGFAFAGSALPMPTQNTHQIMKFQPEIMKNHKIS